MYTCAFLAITEDGKSAQRVYGARSVVEVVSASKQGVLMCVCVSLSLSLSLSPILCHITLTHYCNIPYHSTLHVTRLAICQPLRAHLCGSPGDS